MSVDEIMQNINEVMNSLDEKAKKDFAISQVEMLRRKYADYDENDVVLWLVMDVFLPEWRNMDIRSELALFDNEGNEIPLDGKAVIRFPYPNKAIYHLGFQNGVRKGYGFPIRFTDVNALRKISSINVAWYESSLDDMQVFKARFYINGVKEPSASLPRYTLYRYFSGEAEEKDVTELVTLMPENWFRFMPAREFGFKRSR